MNEREALLRQRSAIFATSAAAAGGNEVRWRPGQEAGLAPLPMFEPEIFPTLLGLYVAPPK